MKNQLHIVLLGALLVLLAGCATHQPAPVAADPSILRVGICPDAPPMIFKENGKIVGVEADLAQALGRELGRKVVFVEMKWEDLIDSLVGEKVDIIMSSMSVTPARRYRIAFTNPYLKVGLMALVRSEDQYKYMMNVEAIASRGIAVKRGTTAEQLVRREFPRAKVKYYSSGDDAAAALVRRSVDLFISDSPMVWNLGARFESNGLAVGPMVFSEELLGWGVSRADTSLRDAANAFLKKSQENGDLNRVFQRWMPGFR